VVVVMGAVRAECVRFRGLSTVALQWGEGGDSQPSHPWKGCGRKGLVLGTYDGRCLPPARGCRHPRPPPFHPVGSPLCPQRLPVAPHVAGGASVGTLMQAPEGIIAHIPPSQPSPNLRPSTAVDGLFRWAFVPSPLILQNLPFPAPLRRRGRHSLRGSATALRGCLCPTVFSFLAP